MSAELSDRLRRLAEEAPAGTSGVGPPAELWARGRRRRRVRMASAVVSVAALAVLAGLGGRALWSVTSPPQPARSPGAEVRLPDHVYTPGPWLAGGQVGPLVAVVGGERRGWLRSGQGLAGVSARTGEYRFLDLPGRSVDAGTAGQALSPDGRWLAYWVVDERFADGPSAGNARAAGVVVYDAVTGESTAHRVASRLGLSPNGLAWAGDTLWFDYSVIAEVSSDGGSVSANGGGTFTWTFTGTRPAAGEPRLAAGTERIMLSSSGVAPSGFTVGGLDVRVVTRDR